MKKISVIIPVYNDNLGLQKTLESLKRQKKGNFTHEVIIENDPNEEGSYKTRNKAFNKSSGDLLAFIDAGSVAKADWLYKGFEYLKRYDYVGGRINLESKDKVLLSKLLFIYAENREFAVSEFMKDSHFAPTTNLFVKRKVFDKVGLFDKRLESSGDLEFGSRVYISGFRQHYANDLVVKHDVRSFFGYIRKHVRLAKGFFDLCIYYPKRYSSFKYNIFKIFIPPMWLFTKKRWLDLNLKEKFVVFVVTYIFSIIQHLSFTRHYLPHILRLY